MRERKKARAAENLLAAATLILAALLIGQCAGAYRAGTAPSNRDAAGVLLGPVFSREIAGARLREIAWAFGLWGIALAAAVAGRIRRPQPEHRTHGRMAVDREQLIGKDADGRRRNILRAALYALAILMIAAGVMNGGMRDVLVKAINICTECIGLG